MSRTRFVACLLTVAATWAAVPARAQFISHIDLAPIPKLDEEECPKTDAEPLAPNAPHTIEGLIGGAKLTPSQAFTNLNVLLEASVRAKAIDALKADASLRDPQAAAATVPAALVQGLPYGALALLLQAQAAAPKDPLHLVNLAGLSNHLGLHREALAMVGEAERLKLPAVRVGGMPVRAVALSNKGYALNATGRPKEAEAALREAIQLAPQLAEAYTNIAYALGDQGQCKLAARYVRAGKTRKPAQVLAQEDKPGEEPPERLPLSDALDLSRGRAGQLPAMHIATSPEDADNANLKRHLDELSNPRETQAALGRMVKLAQAAQAKRVAWVQQGAIGAMSADRAEWLMQLSTEYAEQTHLLMQLAGTPEQFGKRYEPVTAGAERAEVPHHGDRELDSRVRNNARAALEMIAQREAASDAFVQQRTRIDRKYNEENSACIRKSDLLCSSSAKLRRDTAVCVAGKEAAGQRMGSAVAYNAAFRELYTESSRRLGAVASYFSDSAHHQESKERLRWFAHASMNHLAGQLQGHRDAQTLGATECLAANKRQVDLVFDYLKMLEATACKSGGLSGKAGIGVVEAGANCEEVSIGASTPGPVGLFAKVSYEFSKRYEFVKAGKERFLAQQKGLDPHIRLHLPDHDAAFDGKLTVYGGGQVKAEVGGAGADVKAGGYVEFDGKGDVTGYGRKVEGSVSGTIKGIGAEQGIEIKTPLVSPRQGSDD